MPVKECYDARAPEYDDWYLGRGRFAGLDRPDWDEDVAALTQVVVDLPPARTLDVACGTGYLTRHLRGPMTGLDQSLRMLAVAGERLADASLIHGDALGLPFDEDSFDRVFTAHFYGHLEQRERDAFLIEARRVAPELVVVDSAVRPDRRTAEWEERVLNDGSRFEVYKRFFEADRLAEELGGGTVLHQSRWFVVVSSRQSSEPTARVQQPLG